MSSDVVVFGSTRVPRLTDDAGRTLHVRMSYDTNGDLRLQRPITVRLPQGAETVITIRFWVDHPKGCRAAVCRLFP